MSEYVIIGGGIAGLAAAKRISEADYGKQITLISLSGEKTKSKPGLMYSLPGEVDIAQLQRLPDDFYVQNNLNILSKKVHRIDPINRQVVFADNTTMHYGKLLLAYGNAPILPEVGGGENKNVFSLARTSDFVRMQRALPKVEQAVVVGAGKSGLEVASMLARQGTHVVVIEKTNDLLDGAVPKDLSNMLFTELRKNNVQIVLKEEVIHCGGSDGKVSYVETAGSRRYEAQLVVFCCGSKPDMRLIEKTKIRHHHGILVDAQMRTSVDDIWAAGAVVEIEDERKNARMMLPFWSEGQQMGRIAGSNMAGKNAHFDPGAVIISSLIAGKQFHAVGELFPDNTREKHTIIDQENRLRGEFIRLVLKDDILVGACWYGAGPNPFTLKQIIDSESPVPREKKILLDPRFRWEHCIRI